MVGFVVLASVVASVLSVCFVAVGRVAGLVPALLGRFLFGVYMISAIPVGGCW